ncbi:hypothetical protein BH10BAC3_BH10BAC3_33020 [soil metagenome]
MKQIAIVLLTVLVTSISLFAQKYTTAAGIRVGSGVGITVQQKMWDKYTMEAIVQKNLFKDGTNITALFEQHNKVLFKGLNFYIGAGPHFEIYSNAIATDKSTGEATYIKDAFGISAVGGLEMRFKKIVLSYDYQPGINIRGGTNVFTSQTGLSVRYILIKAKKTKKKDKGSFWQKFKKVPEEGDE